MQIWCFCGCEFEVYVELSWLGVKMFGGTARQGRYCFLKFGLKGVYDSCCYWYGWDR